MEHRVLDSDLSAPELVRFHDYGKWLKRIWIYVGVGAVGVAVPVYIMNTYSPRQFADLMHTSIDAVEYLVIGGLVLGALLWIWAVVKVIIFATLRYRYHRELARYGRVL